MNLPDYIRAMGEAANQFEKAVEQAAESYRASMAKARDAFFEDDDRPMRAEEPTRKGLN